MIQKLEQILASTLEAIKITESPEILEEIRIKVLGKKGELTAILRGLGALSPEERTETGKKSNEIKDIIESALKDKKKTLTDLKINRMLQQEWIDVTLNDSDSTLIPEKGHIHPISAMQYEVEDIFTSMGFEILDGPQAETEYYNFEALNIPSHHPARDMQDTFWTEDWNLLRTQTSSLQVRGMDRLKPPFRVIGPGRVFRHETTDASHENTFTQIEGMMVDRDISIAHLSYFMQEMLEQIFKRKITIRLRPGYFPFVEPGFELDIKCLLCGGSGCSVCKRSGWVELLGCGLVHPNVLRYGKIDPEEWSGFAFGFGLERLVMNRYSITDIRHFLGGDLRFLYQF